MQIVIGDDNTPFYEKSTDVDFDVDMPEVDTSGKFHSFIVFMFLLISN